MSWPTVDEFFDLDGMFDAAKRFAHLARTPIAPMDDMVNFQDLNLPNVVATFGKEGGMVVNPTALRPWRRYADAGNRAVNGVSSPTMFRQITYMGSGQTRGRAFPAAHTVELLWGSTDEFSDTMDSPSARRVRRISQRKSKQVQRDYFGWIGGQWMLTGGNRGPIRPAPLDGELSNLSLSNLNVLLGSQLLSEYQWRAVLHDVIPGAAPVALPTDAAGARSLFRLRDKPDDAKRRPALRHWVRDHMRRRPSAERNEEADVFVRSHLRGRVEFTWSGIRVVLEPGAYEMERTAA